MDYKGIMEEHEVQILESTPQQIEIIETTEVPKPTKSPLNTKIVAMPTVAIEKQRLVD